MNPYSRLVEMMEENGEKRNGHDLEEAVVTGISPLALRIGETDVSVNISCHPALVLGLNPSGISTKETALKQCLTSFYSTFQLHAGDRVLVQRVRDRFYVLCRVVAV